MKNLIATLAIAAAFVGVASTASAQAAGPKTSGSQSGSQQQTEDKGMNSIRKDALAQLNLTDDQKKKIKQLHKSNKEKNAALKDELSKGSLTDDQKKDKQQALRKEQLSSLRALLTPDQQKKFDDYIAAESKKMRGDKKKNKPGN